MLNVISTEKCKLKLPWDTTTLLLRWLLFFFKGNTKYLEGCQATGTYYIVGGNAKYYSLSGKQFGNSYKVKDISSHPKEMKTYVPAKTCIWKFVAALFKFTKYWKQSRCPSTSKWINKQWHICAIEHSTAMSRNRLVVHKQHGWILKAFC